MTLWHASGKRTQKKVVASWIYSSWIIRYHVDVPSWLIESYIYISLSRREPTQKSTYGNLLETFRTTYARPYRDVTNLRKMLAASINPSKPKGPAIHVEFRTLLAWVCGAPIKCHSVMSDVLTCISACSACCGSGTSSAGLSSISHTSASTFQASKWQKVAFLQSGPEPNSSTHLLLNLGCENH